MSLSKKLSVLFNWKAPLTTKSHPPKMLRWLRITIINICRVYGAFPLISTIHSKLGSVELLTYFCSWRVREELRALQGMAIQREASRCKLRGEGGKAGRGKSLMSEVSSRAQILVRSASLSLLFQALGLKTGETLGPCWQNTEQCEPRSRALGERLWVPNKADRDWLLESQF